MHRLWLIFAQTVTIALAVLFTLNTLKPEWLGRAPHTSAPPQVTVNSVPASEGEVPTPAGSYREAARTALPAVVHIYTTQEVRSQRHPLFDDPIFRHFFGERPEGRNQRNSGLGSGVIVSADGYILTNFHVIESADDIQVSLNDGKTYKATTVGTDPESDLAVLRITAQDLPAITFGQMENLRVGDVVLAIGNPFGVGQTVTMGIVSALGRSHLGINTFENFIQTDAAINPGNSGGALVDTDGRLLGINTAIYSRSGGSLGIGFAIPVSTARQIMRQIVVHGAVTRGYIGVEPQDITPELARAFGLPREHGAIVAGIVRNGPADRAGVRIGDILVEVDHKAVTGTASMLDTVAQLQPGSTVVFRFLRDGRLLEVPIHIGRRPSRQG